MRKTGTRYLLLCVALIAACLAFMQIPVPPPTVTDINGDVESAPNAIHSILYNFRGVAYVGATSIFMHAVCSEGKLVITARQHDEDAPHRYTSASLQSNHTYKMEEKQAPERI